MKIIGPVQLFKDILKQSIFYLVIILTTMWNKDGRCTVDIHGRTANTKELGHSSCHEKRVRMQGRGILDPTQLHQTEKPKQVTSFLAPPMSHSLIYKY